MRRPFASVSTADVTLASAANVKDAAPKAMALATAAGVLASMKKPDATATFKEARTVAESVEDPFKRVFAMAEVGKRMVNASMFTTGKEVLDATMDLARKQKNQKDLEPLYRELEPYLKKAMGN